MNRKRVISLFVFATLLVIALIVVNYASATANLSTKVSLDRANQADVARWQAMGEYYSKQPASISNFDLKLIRDADAARWQALGEAYLHINSQARQADVARWQAMGEYFSKQSAFVTNFDPKLSRDTNAARWQALGEAYLQINSQARQADVARWQALGEYYTKLQQVEVSQ